MADSYDPRLSDAERLAWLKFQLDGILELDDIDDTAPSTLTEAREPVQE